MRIDQKQSTITRIQKSTFSGQITFRCFEFALIICMFLSQSYSVRAQEDQDLIARSSSQREVTWSFDSSLLTFTKTLPDKSRLEGQAAAFTVGFGRTKDDHWLLGRVHAVSGPWGKALNDSFDTDYSGTIVDIEYGAAVPGSKLRSGSCPVLALAGGYLDLSGRNIGGNRRTRDVLDNSSFYVEQDFKTSVSEIFIMPSIGWMWAKPQRQISNIQSQLNTRIEATTVKLGAIIPLHSKSRISVTKREASSSPAKPPEHDISTGSAKGFALLGSVSLWLGI